MTRGKLLEVEHLTVEFPMPQGPARAVDGVSFDLAPGETLGLVGESGCGKSVTSLSLMGLIDTAGSRIQARRIQFEGRDLTGLVPDVLRRMRGRDMAMFFQEPMTSLNPVLTIGRQVAEPLMVHKGMSKAEAQIEAVKWLKAVKIPAAAQRLNDYPHQLSGGMRQRVMIAMAMICRPKLLIADEPTTALDVTIQAQILSLMLELKAQLAMSLLLITHDLGVVAQMARRVVVMYAGQVVEQAPVADLFDRPFHPYTKGLLKSMPRLGSRYSGSGKRLAEISGRVPALTDIVTGCKFADRCGYTFALCREQSPELFSLDDRRQARCWLFVHPRKGNGHAK